MQFDYNFEMRINAPRPLVFERLLRIEHLSRWFCGWCRIEPKVGGSFRFGGETCILLPEGRAWETTIDEGEVLRRFAFTWPIGTSKTRVAYDLDDGEDETTLLRIRHRDAPFQETTCGTLQDAWRMCLGNLKSIAEGRTDSVRPDHTQPTGSELRLTVLIETRPSRVFEAFADPIQVDTWSTGGIPAGHVRVEPRPGGAFSFGWPDGPDQVMEWARDRRIALRWPQERSTLVVTFEFEEKASGTAIYLSETGFAADRGAEIVRHRGRWSELLVSLKNFVESGTPGFLNSYGDQVQQS